MPTVNRHYFKVLTEAFDLNERRFGIVHVKSMSVQDALPVLFRASNDPSLPLDKGVLWRSSKTSWSILDPFCGVDAKVESINIEQLGRWWGHRILPADGLGLDSEFDTDDGWDKTEVVRYGEKPVLVHKHRLGRLISDKFALSCAFCQCGGDPLAMSHLFMRPDSSAASSSEPISSLLNKGTMFDTEAITTISNGMAHYFFCVAGYPQCVRHLPCLKINERMKELQQQIRAVRAGTECVFPCERAVRFTYVAYYEKHYATLEILFNRRVIIVYEGLNMEYNFRLVAEYVLYKYGLVAVGSDINLTVAKAGSRRIQDYVPTDTSDPSESDWVIVSVDGFNQLVAGNHLSGCARRPKAEQVEHPPSLCGPIALGILPRIWAISDACKDGKPYHSENLFGIDEHGNVEPSTDDLRFSDETCARIEVIDAYRVLLKQLLYLQVKPFLTISFRITKI